MRAVAAGLGLLLGGMLLWGQASKAKPGAGTQANAPGLAAKATAAREAGRLDEAILLYKQALRTAPLWSEGWFFLGSMHYERDEHAPCVQAFQRFTLQRPKVSAGFAFLGLCQFQLRQYGNSLQNLSKAEALGLPQGEGLTSVASYHAALLLTKAGNFEKALRILYIFSRGKDDFDPKAIEASGIAALRKPILPEELQEEDRELVYRVGRAFLTAADRRTGEAAKMFEEIVKEFPHTPHLHYTYGSLLLGGDADKGIAMLQKELEKDSAHLPSLVLLSMEYLNRGDGQTSKKYGEQAVRLAPGNFAARVALGRAYLELEQVPEALQELELAMKLEPTSPQTRIALASAYQKAGRKEEAAKQRAEFLRLKKLLEGNTGQ